MKIDIKQQSFLDPILRQILIWIEDETGFEFTITCIFRPRDKGVHGTIPIRGCDLRCRNKIIGYEIQELINNSWIYDSKRPHLECAILHGAGSNLHLHIQVHANTKKLNHGA